MTIPRAVYNRQEERRVYHAAVESYYETGNNTEYENDIIYMPILENGDDYYFEYGTD